MNCRNFRAGKDKRRAFTIVELLLGIGIIVILTAVTLTTILSRKSRTELDNTVRQIASLLREAQTRSINQASSTSWGVRLENATSNPFYSLFMTSTYSTDTRVGYYTIPASMRYATSSLPVGSSIDITFSQLTGSPSASSSILFELVSGTEVSATATVFINGSGLITY